MGYVHDTHMSKLIPTTAWHAVTGTYTWTAGQVTAAANIGATGSGATASTLTLKAHTHTLMPAGTNTPGAATSVVQPYITVYMWKRTS